MISIITFLFVIYPFISCPKIITYGIFSALLGNAGTVSQQELVKDYGKLLTDTEVIELGFKLFRDTFIFTNKRLILVDKQNKK
ncbi:PH domain-containing protein [Chitinophaga eiseniae]|uniref:PH domain-containing protein n=1 Tax=Chitinophaga eiseniae TaxID=634771 RepID=A0A1T4L253_9BACT|nr:PH domain-containing protein [Chitinophaga eiseniae]SJZ48617.1 PH domain-containing protein [Chitinophaga eiseniae]